MEAMQLIWLIGIGIVGIGVVLHAAGIATIILSKNNSNQTITLLNLSIVDMCGLGHRIPIDIYKYLTYDPYMFEDQEKILNVLHQSLPFPYEYLCKGAFFCIAFQLVGTMTVLTLDRLICITKPLVYMDRVTSTVIRNILIGCWLFSITIGIIRGVFPIIRWYLFYLLLIVLAAYFLLTVVTFIIIFIRIRSSRRRFSTGRERERSSWKFYIVSALIVGTYLLFYLVPALVTTSIKSSKPLTREKRFLHQGYITNG